MVTINIDENLIDTLNQQSSNDAVTVEVWCERKLNAILKQLRKNTLIATVESDIESYEPVIVAKKIEVDALKAVEETEKINIVVNPEGEI